MHFYPSPTELEIKKSLVSHDPNKSSSRLPMLGNSTNCTDVLLPD